ncbi:hypothetical protein OKW40_002961 [Paraburkholderia sp. RAU6.4a]
MTRTAESVLLMCWPPAARRAERVDTQIGRIDLDFADLVRFRHHRDRARRGMDAALRFGGRHALHAMPARLELQLRIRGIAGNSHDHFAIAPEVRFARRHHLDLPAVALGIAQIHAQQIAREQRGFVAAGARADFEENVALVVRVFRQQHFLQFDAERLHTIACCADFLFGEIAHRHVGEQFLRGGGVVLRPAPQPVMLDDRVELRVFARQLAVLVEVGGDVLAAQQVVQFGQPGGQLVELALHARFHRAGSGADSGMDAARGTGECPGRKHFASHGGGARGCGEHCAANAR